MIAGDVIPHILTARERATQQVNLAYSRVHELAHERRRAEAEGAVQNPRFFS